LLLLLWAASKVLPGANHHMEKIVQNHRWEEKVTSQPAFLPFGCFCTNYLEKGGWHDFSSIKNHCQRRTAIPRQTSWILPSMKNINSHQTGLRSTETTPMLALPFRKVIWPDGPAEKLYDIKASGGLPAVAWSKDR